MLENVFYQIGAILGLAAAGGALARFLRQPLIVAFYSSSRLLVPSPSMIPIQFFHILDPGVFPCQVEGDPWLLNGPKVMVIALATVPPTLLP